MANEKMSDSDRCPDCGSPLLPASTPPGQCPQCLLKLGIDSHRATAGPIEDDPDGSAPRNPEQIGPYKILERLGEGGMGVVYLAEQREPIRRRVAVKVIKRGMDTERVIARFEQERQALALMDHPNIARVLEAGTTDDGRPYFAMEFVPGIPITEYCDKYKVETGERLELFVRVCGAIQHAHQKGIIHRDIKPSNVLVAQKDGAPVPKVIDFGVAKATDYRLTESTIFTEQGLLIGTPEYMSPEQAGMSALGIDTRTDIYSLGMLLYELLVGALPFEPQELRRAAINEMQRIIREEEPAHLANRLESLGDAAKHVAERRATNISTLSRRLKGDLDWITLKALEKNPARRYETASAFAADLQRHLSDEPVTASPPSHVYRFRKFVRKNRVAVVAATVVFVVLLGSLVVSSVFFYQERRARLAAVAEAERSALEANAFGAWIRYGEREEEAQLREYLSLANQALDAHRIALGNESAELVRHYMRHLILADFVSPIGRTPESTEQAQQEWYREIARIMAAGLRRGDPAMVENLEMLMQSDGELPEDDDSFIELHRAALEYYDTNRPSSDETRRRVQRNLGFALDDQGRDLLSDGDILTGRARLAEALPLLLQGYGAEHPRTAAAQLHLGEALLQMQAYEEAEPLLVAGHRFFQGTSGPLATNSEYAHRLLVNLFDALGTPERADEMSREHGLKWSIDQARAFTERVQELTERWGLDDPTVRALTLSVEAASEHLEAGDRSSALREIGTFNQRVRALRVSAVLSEEQALGLIDQANRLIERIEGRR